jgi:hypothetical protein
MHTRWLFYFLCSAYNTSEERTLAYLTPTTGTPGQVSTACAAPNVARHDRQKERRPDTAAVFADYPLKNAFDEIGSALKMLQSQYTLLVEQLAQKDKQLDQLKPIEHQYQQLVKLLYGGRVKSPPLHLRSNCC